MLLLDPHVWHRIELVPAIGVGATVGAYVLALRLQRWSGGSAIFSSTFPGMAATPLWRMVSARSGWFSLSSIAADNR